MAVTQEKEKRQTSSVLTNHRYHLDECGEIFQIFAHSLSLYLYLYLFTSISICSYSLTLS